MPGRAIVALMAAALLAIPGWARTWSRPDLVPAAWPGSQYVYGSGEGLAISEQAFAALTSYLQAQMALPRARRHSVLLDMAAMKARCGADQPCMLEHPLFAPCGARPTVVFDADETLLQNRGFEYGIVADSAPFSDARWADWERGGIDRVVAVPGAVDAMRTLRAMGIDPVIITNRDGRDPSNLDSREDFGRYTEQALAHAGLPGFHHGRNLLLRFDDGNRDTTTSGKDARRATLGADRCVLAMAGDQLGDFSDLFARSGITPGRRKDAGRPAFASLWGRGWFVLPNAVYGAGVPDNQDIDSVFPRDGRWNEPAPPARHR